jgi:hypothetical protein
MNTVKYLLATTVLAGGLMLSDGALAEDQSTNTTTNTTTTNTQNETAAATQVDVRAPAQRFIQDVNYARVALAMKDPAQAKDYINQARNQLTTLKNVSVDERQVSRVQSGRLIYREQPNTRNFYFPIETGPVNIRKVDTGPFWAPNKGAAVTDAEIVYITLDLNNDKADQRLNEATSQIDRNEFAAAQSTLESLMNQVVKEDNAVAMPHEKARDNLALARTFIAQRNYDGARYSLNHAKDALDEMEKSARYSDRKDRVLAMRQEVDRMQGDIKRNDPTVLEKADAKIQQWWEDLKD